MPVGDERQCRSGVKPYVGRTRRAHRNNTNPASSSTRRLRVCDSPRPRRAAGSGSRCDWMRIVNVEHEPCPVTARARAVSCECDACAHVEGVAVHKLKGYGPRRIFCVPLAGGGMRGWWSYMLPHGRYVIRHVREGDRVRSPHSTLRTLQSSCSHTRNTPMYTNDTTQSYHNGARSAVTETRCSRGAPLNIYNYLAFSPPN